MKREEWVVTTDVDGPQGSFSVSTIRTYVGGAPDMNASGFGGFSSKDYADETPWPYETMVFKRIGIAGQHHAPYGTQLEAAWGHNAITQAIREGVLAIGHGVIGPWGNPATTPEAWGNSRALAGRG